MLWALSREAAAASGETPGLLELVHSFIFLHKICLMAALAYAVFWWRIRKHFFYFTGLPSDNFTTAFTVSLEQWTFWSSFKAIGSTLLLPCCNYDILYNIFTAFQDKELHFFSEFIIAFIGKVPQHYLISQLLSFSQSFSAILCIKNKKWQGKRKISGLPLTLAVQAAGRFLIFLFRKGELPCFCGHNKWDMNRDLNF